MLSVYATVSCNSNSSSDQHEIKLNEINYCFADARDRMFVAFWTIQLKHEVGNLRASKHNTNVYKIMQFNCYARVFFVYARTRNLFSFSHCHSRWCFCCYCCCCCYFSFVVLADQQQTTKQSQHKFIRSKENNWFLICSTFILLFFYRFTAQRYFNSNFIQWIVWKMQISLSPLAI